jgi:hypothetical protein
MTFFSQIPHGLGGGMGSGPIVPQPTHNATANTPGSILQQMHATAGGMMPGGPDGRPASSRSLADGPRRSQSPAAAFGQRPATISCDRSAIRPAAIWWRWQRRPCCK